MFNKLVLSNVDVMKKAFLTFIVMVGTVIGSGFLSGKEIVVFFSRFGLFSFPCIVFAFFLFWGLFQYFLMQGEKAVTRLENSKLSIFINFFICLVLSGAMFAGSIDAISSAGVAFAVITIALVLLCCFFIICKGLGSLEKLNLLLVPFMVIMLLSFVLGLIFRGKVEVTTKSISFVGIFYSFLYVLLNTSNSGIVIAHMGANLSHKQKARVSFFSALVLCLILLLVNLVLLQNPEAFEKDMPLLSLFDGWQGVVMQVVILFGCVTTLFSLVYSMSQSLRGLIRNRLVLFIICVVAPFLISFLGFGFIVSYFYPVTSVLGACLLSELFFVPFFKQAYKRVHDRGENAKHNN